MPDISTPVAIAIQENDLNPSSKTSSDPIGNLEMSVAPWNCENCHFFNGKNRPICLKCKSPREFRLPALPSTCNCCHRPTKNNGIMCHDDVCGFNQCQHFTNGIRCINPLNGSTPDSIICGEHQYLARYENCGERENWDREVVSFQPTWMSIHGPSPAECLLIFLGMCLMFVAFATVFIVVTFFCLGNGDCLD